MCIRDSFAPIALKTLISKEPLEENDRLLASIKLDKDDYHLLSRRNPPGGLPYVRWL